MKLVFLGPPGAGKGTQAEILSNKINVPHISTGEVFRENISHHTKLGKEAEKLINAGRLAPDEVVNNMVRKKLEKLNKGYILDGYPRTLPQAEFLDSIQDIGKVLNMDLDEKNIVERISGRRVCEDCGKMYHVKYNPPEKKGICSKCSGKLVQRVDDEPEHVKKRLEVYNEQTSPLIGYYEKQGKLIHIDASKSIEEVSEKIFEKIKIKFSI